MMEANQELQLLIQDYDQQIKGMNEKLAKFRDTHGRNPDAPSSAGMEKDLAELINRRKKLEAQIDENRQTYETDKKKFEFIQINKPKLEQLIEELDKQEAIRASVVPGPGLSPSKKLKAKYDKAIVEVDRLRKAMLKIRNEAKALGIKDAEILPEGLVTVKKSSGVGVGAGAGAGEGVVDE
jgi:DNA repair exonuclease SbcCD ATPase subunit